MTLVVDTNTYGTLVESETYCSERYGYGSWAALTDAIKEQALISATQQLDVYCTWYGYLSDIDQALAFPRVPDSDPTPDNIKNAQFEIAYAITVAGSTATDGGDPLTELKAGSVTLKFDAKSTSNPLINDLTTKLLSQYGMCGGSGSTKIVPILRQ
jgi:hypothetical protein